MAFVRTPTPERSVGLYEGEICLQWSFQKAYTKWQSEMGGGGVRTLGSAPTFLVPIS